MGGWFSKRKENLSYKERLDLVNAKLDDAKGILRNVEDAKASGVLYMSFVVALFVMAGSLIAYLRFDIENVKFRPFLLLSCLLGGALVFASRKLVSGVFAWQLRKAKKNVVDLTNEKDLLIDEIKQKVPFEKFRSDFPDLFEAQMPERGPMSPVNVDRRSAAVAARNLASPLDKVAQLLVGEAEGAIDETEWMRRELDSYKEQLEVKEREIARLRGMLGPADIAALEPPKETRRERSEPGVIAERQVVAEKSQQTKKND